jgi:hypothetical protein
VSCTLATPSFLAPLLSPAHPPFPLHPSLSPPFQETKKQRELYIGNLAVGMVTPPMLKELFTLPLEKLATGGMPPVMEARVDANGKVCVCGGCQGGGRGGRGASEGRRGGELGGMLRGGVRRGECLDVMQARVDDNGKVRASVYCAKT